MSWQKEIRPTRENSSLPLYDDAPKAAAEPEPLSRREQRRLRRRTARNFSEVAQIPTADDPENEPKVRKSKKGRTSANEEQDSQDDANTTAETIGESSKDSPSDAPVASSSDPETGSPGDEDCGEADKQE